MTRFLSILFLLISINCFSQLNESPKVYPKSTVVNARVYDVKTGQPLSFANIGIKNTSKGSISNEDGVFQLNIEGFNSLDSIIVRYVGYKNASVNIADLLEKRLVPMQEDIINVSEFFVYGNEIDGIAIVSKVLENRSKNYHNNTLETEMFIRNRYSTDVEELKIKQLKNSFKQLSDKITRQLEEQIPKHNLSYTDFLGKVYLNQILTSEAKMDDKVKVKEEKVIGLRDDLEMGEIEDSFGKIINETKDNEYWKVASGVFRMKVDTDDGSDDDDEEGDKDKKGSVVVKIDTAKKAIDYKNTVGSWFLRQQIDRSADYISMNDESQWSFLHSPKQYEYKLEGGLKIDGEEVYIISFTPKRRGDFEGTLYISCESYALIKAEYQYAEGRNGVNISLLGISYTESEFRVSILFEKYNGKYQLKYLFKREGEIIGVERKIALIKKRERFMLDKTVATFKVKLNYKARNLNSIELLVLSQNEITEAKFKALEQKERMKVKYVRKFDDTLWEGYSIIAPTVKMKEYQKH